MNFKDKYTSVSEKEKNKIVIPDESFALCEVLSALTETLEGLRLKAK